MRPRMLFKKGNTLRRTESERKNATRLDTPSPRGISNLCCEAGLRACELGFPSSWMAPSQAISSSVAIANQVNIQLTYRCGGSIGIVFSHKNAPISQFHPCLLKANQAPDNMEIITLICKKSLNIF